jgi:hypothetical protein
MRGDQKVQRTDRAPLLFEIGADLTVVTGSGRIEIGNQNLLQEVVELSPRSVRRRRFCDAYF